MSARPTGLPFVRQASAARSSCGGPSLRFSGSRSQARWRQDRRPRTGRGRSTRGPVLRHLGLVRRMPLDDVAVDLDGDVRCASGNRLAAPVACNSNTRLCSPGRSESATAADVDRKLYLNGRETCSDHRTGMFVAPLARPPLRGRRDAHVICAGRDLAGSDGGEQRARRRSWSRPGIRVPAGI